MFLTIQRILIGALKSDYMINEYTLYIYTETIYKFLRIIRD